MLGCYNPLIVAMIPCVDTYYFNMSFIVFYRHNVS